MTSPQVMDALSTDVERALQHAIGQANQAFATGLSPGDTGSHNRERKKSKKRARTGAADEIEQPKERKRKAKDAIEGNEQLEGKRRKKKRKHDQTEDGPACDSNIDPSLLHEAAGTLPEVTQTKKKKKKSKQNEHTIAASQGFPATDPTSGLATLPSDPVQTAAIVSTTADHDPHPHGPYYSQPDPSYLNFDTTDGPLPELNTNDDILRVFQDLDLTRLAGVLRSLDLPTSPSPSHTHLDGMLPGSSTAAFLDQDNDSTNAPNPTQTSASKSNSKPRRESGSAGPSTQAKRPKKSTRPVPVHNPNLATMGPSIAKPEHTHILATKWLSATKLKEMVETEGLVYKKGKFSALEEQALKAAIEDYRVGHGLLPEQLTEVIFAKKNDGNDTFWSDITKSVPARPIIAVYHHVRRANHPLKLQGKWSGEEDSALTQAITDLGQAWEKVSELVGRTAQDCRDRWRNHVNHRSERQRGHWTKAEEEELTRIVTELTTDQGKSSDNDVFWGIISQRMGNKRGRQQCRIKWMDSLSKTMKNAGRAPRWGGQDAYILVHKVASLNIRDDSEIDWKLLPDPDWNFWSAHLLQRRWRTLKHSIKGHEEMAFQEIVEILKQKHAHLPPHITGRRATQNNSTKVKIVSSEVIDEDGDEVRRCDGPDDEDQERESEEEEV